MSKRVVLSVLPPAEHQTMKTSIVTTGEVFSELGEVFNPNTTTLGIEDRWLTDKFILFDEEGNRIYCVPGDIVPTAPRRQFGRGMGLLVDESIERDGLIFTRVEKRAKLEQITVGQPWEIGKQAVDVVTRVVAIDVANDLVAYSDTKVIPPIEEPAFETLKNDIHKLGNTKNLHELTRLILSIEQK